MSYASRHHGANSIFMVHDQWDPCEGTPCWPLLAALKRWMGASGWEHHNMLEAGLMYVTGLPQSTHASPVAPDLPSACTAAAL